MLYICMYLYNMINIHAEYYIVILWILPVLLIVNITSILFRKNSCSPLLIAITNILLLTPNDLFTRQIIFLLTLYCTVRCNIPTHYSLFIIVLTVNITCIIALSKGFLSLGESLAHNIANILLNRLEKNNRICVFPLHFLVANVNGNFICVIDLLIMLGIYCHVSAIFIEEPYCFSATWNYEILVDNVMAAINLRRCIPSSLLWTFADKWQYCLDTLIYLPYTWTLIL